MLGLIICWFMDYLNLEHEIQPTRSSVEESTRTQILDLCQTQLELDIMDLDISTAHRIFSSDKDKHRPILVSFTSRRARNLVFGAKKALRSRSPPSQAAPIYINEHLTKNNAHIYARARKLVKEKKLYVAWMVGGITHVLRTPALDEKPRRIRLLEAFQPHPGPMLEPALLIATRQ